MVGLEKADKFSQSSEARLYTFSGETKDHLRKFRLGTSRSNDPQAVICMCTPPPIPSGTPTSLFLVQRAL